MFSQSLVLFSFVANWLQSSLAIRAVLRMAGVLRRLFKVLPPTTRPLLELQADWSAISPSGLGLVFKELLADFVGAPPPRDVLEAREFYNRAWKTATVSDLYFLHRHLVGTVNPGFLVRGIIYDMPSLIHTEHKVPANASESAIASTSNKTDNVAEKYDVKRRDWSSLLLDFDANVVDTNTVSADQVIESLGLKAVPGLQNRVETISTPRKDKNLNSKLEETRAFEEHMGRGDGIRAKYGAKIFQKKMLAEARREQMKLGIFPTAAPKASSKGWQAMPGAPALVRYLEERGLKQALLARGTEEDLACLLDQLGNYKFQHVSHVSNGNDGLAPVSNERLKRICTSWSLPPKQVMVVIGSGEQGEAALTAMEDSGFFVCRVNNSSHEQTEQQKEQQQRQEKRIADTSETDGKTNASKKGLVSWFTHLKEGTLHVEDHDARMRHLFPKGHVHFSVTDMVELKWVIEDLNGVSYRKSTLISGFQDLGLGGKQS